ncbi:phage holin family protein [Vibrio rhizosphaerae]|uniref:Phage holin family protein n=1 Tax=Vibrio rhizosphaerae TaxID=398736 RepID=A0ABU4ITB9_9VIBR|nr:phage holin family protein [Vibrio rhizosphaerae]MDW6092540.1 phage holin family protein [Vibrio rhizosphaerae]
MNDSGHMTTEDQGPTTDAARRAAVGADTQDVKQEAEQAVNSIRTILTQIEGLATSLKTWSDTTLDLFVLEVKTNIAAARQIVLCSIVFILLAVLFIFSLCLTAGIVTYDLTAHVLLSCGVFIGSLGLALFGLAWWQQRLTNFLGFKHTTEQLREGWDALSDKTQPGDADQTD